MPRSAYSAILRFPRRMGRAAARFRPLLKQTIPKRRRRKGVQPLSAPETRLICAVFGPEVVMGTSILKPGPGSYSTLAILPPMTASDRRTTYVYVPARSTETAPLCAAGTPGGTWCRTTSPRSLGHLCPENSPTTPSALVGIKSKRTAGQFPLNSIARRVALLIRHPIMRKIGNGRILPAAAGQTGKVFCAH